MYTGYIHQRLFEACSHEVLNYRHECSRGNLDSPDNCEREALVNARDEKSIFASTEGGRTRYKIPKVIRLFCVVVCMVLIHHGHG